MKKIIVYPEEASSEFREVLLYKEPRFFHSVLWIILAVFAFVAIFVVFGKVDEVVRAEGIVRPENNVSSVKNIISGEIENVFYENGKFVGKGETLLSLKDDSVVAEKKAVLAQLDEISERLESVSLIISLFSGSDFSFSLNSLKSSDFSSSGFSGSAFLEIPENILSRLRASPSGFARYKAFVSEFKVLDARAERMQFLYEEESSLPSSITSLSAIRERKYNAEMAHLEKQEYVASFFSELKQEENELSVSRENLVQQLNKIEVSLENLVLVSPVSGYVQEVSSLNSGDYIFSDQKILNIVPLFDSSCRIELHIPSARVGKLEKGQKVKLRFPAFPYSEFSGIEGKITVIQPDAEYSDSSLYFTAFAEVDSMVLKNRKNIEYKIKPGFEVDARIVLERQRVLYFLLKRLSFAL